MIFLIIIAVIISAIAFSTASWRVLHNFFFKLIKGILGFVLTIIFLYAAWTLLWKAVPKDSDPQLTKYLIDRHYYGKADSVARKAFDKP